ncbi:MAG: hypothetical protein KBG54_06855 [Oscillospiraceae bacterium]|nr:hypothetical protein [Oscillospiraceae bacterium]
MGFFFQGYTFISVVAFVLLVAALVLLNELTRRNKIFAILLYCIFPIILVALIAMNVVGSPSSKTWFGVVKTYSALIGVIGFMLIRYTKLGNKKFAWYFPVAILAINIVEAIARDIEVYKTYKTLTVDAAGVTLLGGPWNILNALAGLFLLCTLTGWMGIKVANTKSKDMIWADQLWFWILAYDLWNIAYCYNCISTRAMYAGVALIVSCSISEIFFKTGAWLQHRAQTLALFGMFSLAVDYQSSSAFGITSTYNPTAWTIVSAIALIVNMSVFGYEIYRIIKLKRNPLKQEMYTELASYKNNLEQNQLLSLNYK